MFTPGPEKHRQTLCGIYTRQTEADQLLITGSFHTSSQNQLGDDNTVALRQVLRCRLDVFKHTRSDRLHLPRIGQETGAVVLVVLRSFSELNRAANRQQQSLFGVSHQFAYHLSSPAAVPEGRLRIHNGDKGLTGVAKLASWQQMNFLNKVKP